MSFIATGAEQAEEIVSNDGFFPDIYTFDLRAVLRMDGTATSDRLTHSLIDAIASVNGELAVWKAAQIAATYTTLADVPATSIGDVSIQVHRYRRAVYALTKANMVERYRDFDATNAGNKKADQMENPIDDLRRDARWAISDILGIGRTTVELI
jgi:hypothetical protein